MARRNKVKKGDMVRQAIEAGKGLPSEGIAWIREQFGVHMKPNNFSNFKSMLNRGAGSSVARRPRGAVIAKAPTGAGSGIRLEELATLRTLVDRVGPQGIAEAVSLLTGK